MSGRAIVALPMVLFVAAAALAIRTRCVAIYAIPSGSMMPGLLAGDYLGMARWPFAVRHLSPRRGDIVVFVPPSGGGAATAKRVIGLPGDRIALRQGSVVLNGRAVPRWRVADLIVPVTPNMPCPPRSDAMMQGESEGESERPACRFIRVREMPPGSAAYDILDAGGTAGDDRMEVTVPSSNLFVLGDNRDRLADGRFAAGENGGGEFVPTAAVIGRAGVLLFSIDGSARLADPRGWLGAVRWRRIGTRF